MAKGGIVIKPKPILVIDKKNGQIVSKYASSREAERELFGFDNGSISNSARNNRVSFGRYIYRYEDEWSGREVFERTGRPIIAKNLKTNELIWFESDFQASSAFCYSKRYMSDIARGNKILDGFAFTFQKSTDDPLAINARAYSDFHGARLK